MTLYAVGVMVMVMVMHASQGGPTLTLYAVGVMVMHASQGGPTLTSALILTLAVALALTPALTLINETRARVAMFGVVRRRRSYAFLQFRVHLQQY